MTIKSDKEFFRQTFDREDVRWVKFSPAWGDKKNITVNPKVGLEPGERAKTRNSFNNGKWIFIGTRYGTVVVSHEGTRRTFPGFPRYFYQKFGTDSSLSQILGSDNYLNIGQFIEDLEDTAKELKGEPKTKLTLWQRIKAAIVEFFNFE